MLAETLDREVDSTSPRVVWPEATSSAAAQEDSQQRWCVHSGYRTEWRAWASVTSSELLDHTRSEVSKAPLELRLRVSWLLSAMVSMWFVPISNSPCVGRWAPGVAVLGGDGAYWESKVNQCMLLKGT
jgi:hypothetical protein